MKKKESIEKRVAHWLERVYILLVFLILVFVAYRYSMAVRALTPDPLQKVYIIFQILAIISITTIALMLVLINLNLESIEEILRSREDE